MIWDASIVYAVQQLRMVYSSTPDDPVQYQYEILRVPAVAFPWLNLIAVDSLETTDMPLRPSLLRLMACVHATRGLWLPVDSPTIDVMRARCVNLEAKRRRMRAA